MESTCPMALVQEGLLNTIYGTENVAADASPERCKNFAFKRDKILAGIALSLLYFLDCSQMILHWFERRLQTVCTATRLLSL